METVLSASRDGRVSEPARRPISLSPRLVIVLAITLVALLLRLRAAFLLPIDADEPAYMAVASRYAQDMQAGNLWGVIALDRTLEHPALVKLLYALQLVVFQPSDSDVALHLLRGLSAVFGAAQVLLLALLNPLAGFALAIHTMTIKYTSQVYLEAVPGFFAIASIVAFERYRTDSRIARWLIVSAVCLGATAAGKYPYLAVGLAMLPFLPWRERNWRVIGAFVSLAAATFFLLNISLWADPVVRFLRSLLFHPAYSQSTQVTRYGFPWWKPLDYLLHPVPWHPGVFYLGWDGWIFALGLLGLPLLWRRSQLYTLWAIASLVALFLWPTKWPQYTLIVIPPLCLSLGNGIVDVVHWADERFQLRYYLAPFMAPRSTIILAGLAGMAVALVLFFEGLLYWQGNLGWRQINTHNSALVSDYVQALVADKSGRVWAGTRFGLSAFDGEAWTTYTSETGALPDDSVQALAIAPDGALWVGTARGIAVFDGTGWRRFQAAGAGSGPSGDDVRGLAIGPDGRVWAATTSGLSVYDGRFWTPYRAGVSGLPSDLVFAVTVAKDGRIWASTDRGAGVLDPNTQSWQRYDRTNSGLEWEAVRQIAIAHDGRVWLGTLGGGITVFDGKTWNTLTTANSELPWNMIMAIAAGPEGDIWVAADLPTTAGGNVARWDGKSWMTYTTQRSGIAAGSASCFAFDSEGRVYIGMRNSGISIFAPPPEQRR